MLFRSKTFNGDSKLSTVNIRSASSLNGIGKGAFGGIAPRATFRIHGTKKEFEKVKKLILSSGVGKKVKFKRV